ncbi:MAG TPA: hypothetical protein VJ720_04645 [Chitinophaga sp.]|nr:hypothetical protein [Chitinophaga sp.]
MTFFDEIQNTAFDIVTSTFGYTASWLPSEGGPEQSATVLYKDATEKHELSNVDYIVERYVMEYKEGDFTGLKEAVARGENESVKIIVADTVTLLFMVRKTETKYDGKTITATLNPPVTL